MKCPVCSLEFPSWSKVLTHVVAYHGGESVNVTCNIDGCQRTFKDTGNWRRHAYRFPPHRISLGLAQFVRPVVNTDEASTLNEASSENEEVMDNETNDVSGNEISPIQAYSKFHSLFHKHFLSFTMKIREEHLLPQSTVTSIVDGMEGLFELYTTNVFSIIKNQLTIDPEPSNLEYIFEDENFFSSMCAVVRNDRGTSAAVAMHLPFVKPIDVVLGRPENKKAHIIHIVPLIDSLKAILAHDELVDEILAHQNKLHSYTSNEKLHDIIYDITSSGYNSPINVPLLFYIDEFEPCNPIGSRKKIHKLSGVYYTLACLPPRLRSSLKCIFLYCLAYYRHVVNYGYEAIFKDVIRELKELHNETLRVVTANGRDLCYRVQLKIFSADNLSAHDLCGFQKHFSSGKISRYCLVDHRNLKANFDFTRCPLRTDDEYDMQISTLDTAVPAAEHGIRGRCVFSELTYVKPLKLCPPDVMHDFLEGVVPIVVCVALSSLMGKLKLSIDDINEAIQSFQYGKSDKTNKYGPIISKAHLKKLSIPGTASEKFCLIRMLPLMLSLQFPRQINKKLQGIKLLYLCLEISDIIMAPVINREWLAELHDLIIKHHTLISRLNPKSIKPKFHYLIHYPQLIAVYGPPRHYFTMRFESLHQYFKRLTSKTRNFINLTHTLSTRFQNLKAHYLGQAQFFTTAKNMSGSSKVLSSLGTAVVSLFRERFEDCGDEKVYVTHTVTIKEVNYTQGYVFVSKLLNGDVETPQFLKINTIICRDALWYAVGESLTAVGFSQILHAYEVSGSTSLDLLELGMEVDHTALSVYKVQEKNYVPLKYGVTKHVSSIPA